MREVVSSQKCHQLEESTSAESPSRHGERDIKTGGKLSEDHSLEHNPADSSEYASMPLKPRSFKESGKGNGGGSSASGSPVKRLKGRKNPAKGNKTTTDKTLISPI